ncbi:MAG: ATP-binding protein, partial [Chloroflexota bacterium]
MEKLEEILKRKRIGKSTSKADSNISSTPEVCPICRGLGFVYAPAPFGHADFGKAVPCQCLSQESPVDRQARLRRYSNLGPLAWITFDRLSTQGRGPAFARAYEAALSFAREPHGWLVLVGPSGNGKTRLAAAIINYRLSQEEPGLFMSVAEILDHLRATLKPDSEVSYDVLLEQLRAAPLLVLDDLGPSATTPWAREKLLQLVDYRYNAQLPTMFTTRSPLAEMEEPLASRLGDPELSRVVVLEDSKHGRGLGQELAFHQDKTFERWDKRLNLNREQQQNLQKVHDLAWEFAQKPEGWRVFLGETGCGKTNLAAAIANYCQAQGQSPLFIKVPDLLDHLRATFSPESKVSYDQLFEQVKQSPLLILDDFGEQSSTPWAWEKLYQVISYRHNSRLPT